MVRSQPEVHQLCCSQSSYCLEVQIVNVGGMLCSTLVVSEEWG
jgi:hypothetical protein